MFDLVWKNEPLWRNHAGAQKLPPPPNDIAVSRVAPLLWEEHCIECAPPECYTSCYLYVPRRDQKCARFVYGIFPNAQVAGAFDYGADMLLRRWAKIEASWNGAPEMLPLKRIRRYERWGQRLGGVANRIADVLQPLDPRRRANGLYTLLRRKWVAGYKRKAEAVKIDAFYAQFFYPGENNHALQLEVCQDRPVYRTSISVTPGWNEKIIPFADLNLMPDHQGRLSLCSTNDKEIRLIFTWLDLVIFENPVRIATSHENYGAIPETPPASKVKCLVWDLDNTLWEGVIGELGPENVRPIPEALDLIRKMDERGIIQSIASKNSYELAWRKVDELGLADYFLYPAIHWGRKSESLRRIAEELNVNVDTIGFIDDSAFERAEVSAALPQVRVYHANQIDRMLSMDEFDVPVTETSRRRRLSYLSEAKRRDTAASWGSDYEGFLRSCNMAMHISVVNDTHKDRCLELLQRTNQLNLSGRRFSREQFDCLLRSNAEECFAFSCSDKFGDYGIVGFVSVDIRGSTPTITDFVVSCRVAQKRVEETFLYWYACKAQDRGADRLRAVFVPTERNAPLCDVLDKLLFKEVDRDAESRVLEFVIPTKVSTPNIIKVEEL